MRRLTITGYLPALAAVIFVALAVQTATASDIKLSLTSDKKSVGLDDYLNIKVTVTGTGLSSTPKPEISGLDDFDLVGESTGDRISIVNMEMKRTTIFSYALKPKTSGKTAKLMATLVYKGHTYSSNTVAVELVKSTAGGKPARPQANRKLRGFSDFFDEDVFKPFGRRRFRPDDFMLQAWVNSPRVYVGQEVIYTLAYYRAYKTWSEPKYQFPDTKGFWREEVSKPEKVRTKTAMVAERQYTVSETSLLLYPLTDGKLTIGRGNVQFQTDAFAPQMKLESGTVEMEILPLPSEGKPENFSGLVGDFSIKAVTKEQDAEAGKPIMLKVIVSGKGNIHSTPKPMEPDFSLLEKYEPEIDDNFTRTPEGSRGSRSFSYLLVPKKEGTLEIGAFETNFFNPATGEYRILKTEPINIEVKRPPVYPIAERQAEKGPGRKIPTAGISRVKPDVKKLVEEGFPYYQNIFFWAYLIFLTAILLGTSGYMRRQRAIASDQKVLSGSTAMRKARKHLANAEKFLSAGDGDRFYLEVERALRGYIADKLGLKQFQISQEEIKKGPDGIKSAWSASVLEILEKCETIRFGPVIANPDEMKDVLEKSGKVLNRLEKTL